MDSPCNRCKRRDLPIYLALYAAAPKELVSGRLPLGGNFGGGVTDKPLTESAYVLRGLEPGYVYLLCGQSWRGYLVDAAGYPNYYPDLRIEDMPDAVPAQSLTAQCERQGKSHTGVEAISIEYPELIEGAVYIAYSRHKWTKAVRREVAKAPAQHMQLVAKLDGSPFAHAEAASADNLRKWVVDFDKAAVAMLNRQLSEGAKLQDRSDKAEGLAKAMLASSGKRQLQGLIMALHDPVGIAAALNATRNAQVERVLALDGKTTQVERDDMVIASTLRDLKASLQASGGDWPRHEKHLDLGKFNAALQKIEDRKKLAARVDAMSADYVKWMSAPATKAVFGHQFDPAVPASGHDMEALFAACIVGSGTTQAEREQVWQPWIDAAADDPANLLWRAASGNDPALLAFMVPGKLDKLFDFSKTGKDLYKETPWFSHQLEVAHAMRQQAALRRDYTAATAAISQTLAAQMMWLYRKDAKKFLRTTAQMATLLAGRGDVAVLPRTITARTSQYLRWVQETYLGQPKAYKPLQAVPNASATTPKRVDASKLADAELRQEVQALQGALLVDVSGSRDKVLAFTDWAATRLQPGQAPDEQMQKLLRQLKMEPADLSLSAELKINLLSQHLREVRVAKLDMAFSHGTAWMQLIAFFYNFNGLMTELKKAPDQRDALAVESGWASLGTVLLTSIAAGLEIGAAKNLIANQGAKTLAYRYLTVSAGGLGIVCGATDAYYQWKQADKLAADGDGDAAKWTDVAAVGTGLSALLIGGAAIAGGLGASGVGLPIAVAMGLVLGVAALASSFVAAKKTSTDLEKWLDRCRFGLHRRPDSQVRFRTLEEELEALRLVLYAVAVISDLSTVDHVTIRSHYKVAVPFYAGYSQLEVQVLGTPVGGKERVLKTLQFMHGTLVAVDNADKAAVVVDQFDVSGKNKSLALDGEIAVRALPSEASYDRKTGGVMLRVGSIQKDVTGIPYFTALAVRVSYRPDAKTWPDFVVETRA